MASIFCCGFECGVLGTAGNKWENVANASISTATVRNGARSLRVNSTGAAAWAYAAVTSGTTLVARFAFYIDESSAPASNLVLAGFFTATSVSVGIARTSAGQYVLARQVGGGSFNQGTNSFSLSTGWHYADLRVNVSANPWVIEGYIDGVAMNTYSPALAATTLSGLVLGPITSTTIEMFFDDVVISATSGDFPIGDGYVNHFVPTADGTHNIAGANDYEITLTGTDIINSTTDAYLLIDDVPLESTPGDFINMIAPTASSYTEHIFGPAPGISTPTSAPRSVDVVAAIHQSGTGAGNMEILLNDNGSLGTVYTATGVAGSTSIVYKRAHFADPPSAATAWNVNGDGSNGDFLDLRVRFGATGTADANPDQYLDGVMVEAEFAPAVPTVFTVKDIICGGMVIPFDRP